MIGLLDYILDNECGKKNKCPIQKRFGKDLSPPKYKNKTIHHIIAKSIAMFVRLSWGLLWLE